MRAVSWLFLILSFALGISCAFIVRHYKFEAKPVPIVVQGPTVKILVAQKAIPQGAEITAIAVAFVEVPIAEVPSEAATNFTQVSRRQAVFPIPVGCPICEDLLLPPVDADSETAKYLPAGMQSVSLEIEQIRLGENISELTVPITDYLTSDRKVDIRILPKEKTGSLVERKNQLIKAFMPKNEVIEKGKLFLDNFEIHQITSQPTIDGKRSIQTLTLLLEKENAEKLTIAARKGRIRVVPHRQTVDIHGSPESETVTAGNITEEETIAVTSSLQPFPQSGEVSEESEEEVNPPLAISPNTAALPTNSDISETGHDIEPVLNRTKLLFVPSQILPEEHREKVHNDVLSIMDAPLPEFSLKKADTFETMSDQQKPSFQSRPSFQVVEIGLPIENKPETTDLSSGGYSPWGRRSTVIKSETEKSEESDVLPQPLPLRSRKNLSLL
jgi:Flp pilus assembly protein CpaB